MSPQSWLELFSLRDLIDIALVAIVAYNLLLLIRGTRAVQALVGILAIGGVYYVASAFELAARHMSFTEAARAVRSTS